jgi:hypothetical protein
LHLAYVEGNFQFECVPTAASLTRGKSSSASIFLNVITAFVFPIKNKNHHPNSPCHFSMPLLGIFPMIAM